MGVIAPPSRKCCRFFKKHKNKFIRFVLPHPNFCPAVEKCYRMSILLKCL